MYLLYVDPSGTPELSDHTRLYVTLGICVHEGAWFGLDKRARRLKASFLRQGRDFELHAKDMCQWYPEQDEIEDFSDLDFMARYEEVAAVRKRKLAAEIASGKRAKRAKKYRSTEPYIHLERRERTHLYEETLDLVGAHDGIRLFTEIVDKEHFRGSSPDGDIVRHSLAQLVSRFDKFLTNYNRGSRQGQVDNGIIVMDQDPNREALIRKIIVEYRESGHPWGAVNHVMETPFFVDSADASLIQLADVCAYAVRRYVENGARKGSFEEQNFLRIYHRFDRVGPVVHGARHYCRKGSCTCRICLDRGHAG